jgi:F-type H+-transporting ATPase subunit delta
MQDIAAVKVARVYAEALLAQALHKNETQPILEDLEALIKMLDAHPDLEKFLLDGFINREVKAGIIENAFRGRVDDLLTNFLLVVNEHERLELLRVVAIVYRRLLDDREGRQEVGVRSAVPLPNDQQERLRDELQRLFHIKPVLKLEVDPALLGGLQVRIGDWIYDASVRTRLESMQNEIIERSSHEIQSGRDRFCNK